MAQRPSRATPAPVTDSDAPSSPGAAPRRSRSAGNRTGGRAAWALTPANKANRKRAALGARLGIIKGRVRKTGALIEKMNESKARATAQAERRAKIAKKNARKK